MATSEFARFTVNDLRCIKCNSYRNSECVLEVVDGHPRIVVSCCGPSHVLMIQTPGNRVVWAAAEESEK
jgi:hypothetical protein